MRQGWLDPKRRQFTANRLAAVLDVAPDRLAELADLQRAHAQLYRDSPLSGGARHSRSGKGHFWKRLMPGGQGVPYSCSDGDRKKKPRWVGVALVCGRLESPVCTSVPFLPAQTTEGFGAATGRSDSALLRRRNVFEVTEDRAGDRSDVGGSGRPEDIDLGIVGETRINHHPH